MYKRQALVNPLQVFKIAAVLNLRDNLEILGPAGIYAFQRYGAALLGLFLAVLAAWIVLPALLAYLRLVARGDF